VADLPWARMLERLLPAGPVAGWGRLRPPSRSKVRAALVVGGIMDAGAGRETAAAIGEWIFDLSFTAAMVREGEVGARAKWVGSGSGAILAAAYNGLFGTRAASVAAARAALWIWVVVGQWAWVAIMVRWLTITARGCQEVVAAGESSPRGGGKGGP